MTTDGTWQSAVGTIASTAGLTGFALTGVQGAIASYHALASPHASLTKSERMLQKVKARLQDLSPQRREEIEIAVRSGSSEFTSMEHLEKTLVECVLIDADSFSNISSLWKYLVSWTCTVD